MAEIKQVLDGGLGGSDIIQNQTVKLRVMSLNQNGGQIFSLDIVYVCLSGVD